LRTSERDLRSLDRPGLYRVFAPLDEEERLPRELLMERPTRHLWGYELGWSQLAGLLWIPTMALTVAMTMWLVHSALAALAMTGLLLIVFKLIAAQPNP